MGLLDSLKIGLHDEERPFASEVTKIDHFAIDGLAKGFVFQGDSAADLLRLAADTRPIEEGMAETIEYYAKLPRGRLQSALAFYYGQRVPTRRAARRSILFTPGRPCLRC